MKRFVFFMVAAVNLCFADPSVKKVVFDLTSGDVNVLERKILKGIPHAKNYYESHFQELETAVVIHGNAYKFFVKHPEQSVFKDDKVVIERRAELSKRLESLAKTYKTEFLMCSVGMEKNGLKPQDIDDYVVTVASATVGLIDKQNDGYAYLPAD